MLLASKPITWYSPVAEEATQFNETSISESD